MMRTADSFLPFISARQVGLRNEVHKKEDWHAVRVPGSSPDWSFEWTSSQRSGKNKVRGSRELITSCSVVKLGCCQFYEQERN